MTTAFRSRRRRRGATLAVAFVAVAAAAGCSSEGSASEGSGSGGDAKTATTVEAVTVAFESEEADLPTTFPEPTVQPGFEFKIGYSNPFSAVPSLAEQERAAKEATEELGGTFVSTDANGQVQKQVSDFEQLLSQDVDAIILSALDPNSLAPLLEKAESQGVLVFVNDVPFKAGLPPVDGFAATILSGNDRSAYERAKVLAEAQPGARYGLIGVSIPAPMLDYYVDQVKFWGDQFGLEFVERVDAETDSPEAGAKAATALLSKHDDLDAVFALGDSIALGVSTSAKGANYQDLKIIGAGGYAPALAAIDRGDLFATWFTDSGELHRQLVWAAYNKLTDPDAELPAQVTLGNGFIVTAANTDEVPDPIG